MSYINVSEIRYQNISSLQHIHDQKYVIKTKSSFMTRKLNFPKKISDLIICHPCVRTKMVSNPCNISTTRLMMKFIWFYVVPRTIFLMPVVKFVYFQTLHVTKSYKIRWVILHKMIKWEQSYITQCKAYQRHLAASSFLAKTFLRLYSCFSIESYWITSSLRWFKCFQWRGVPWVFRTTGKYCAFKNLVSFIR